jgi:hypothetical protein
MEQSSEKPRPEKLAEALVPVFIESGIVSEEYCAQLAHNPALRQGEITKQTENIRILIEQQDITDVNAEELAERLVDFLILRGLQHDDPH